LCYTIVQSSALFSPAADRNKESIADVLRRVLPQRGRILEVASGSGQHAVHFARALSELEWQPSDPDASARASIAGWIQQEQLPNIAQPLALDVHTLPWPVKAVDAVICINMIHIAPWSAAQALLSGARDVLATGGVLYLYGPHRQNREHTAPSNAAFDRSLRAQNPAWGVRDLEDVVVAAGQCGFEFVETVGMPANNLSVIFRRH
jgi:SAM-dependent methyltransferase